MTLKELKIRVDFAISQQNSEELVVVIPNSKPSMGGIATIKVQGAGRGIDWNGCQFIIWPEVEMINKPIDK